jgi:hypothetical protein
MAKKLLSLKPVVRTRTSYKRVAFRNGKNVFKDSLYVWPGSVDFLTNAYKVLRDTFYHVSYLVNDCRF